MPFQLLSLDLVLNNSLIVKLVEIVMVVTQQQSTNMLILMDLLMEHAFNILEEILKMETHHARQLTYAEIVLLLLQEPTKNF